MQDATQPSTANIAVASAIVAGVTGYMLGQAKSLGLFGGSPIFTPAQGKEKAASDDNDDDDDDDDLSDEDSEVDDSVPADFKDNNEECKLVLVVRTDLGMTKGISSLHARAPC
jgi:PTH2 family peptidyl-tRNA hydrolase